MQRGLEGRRVAIAVLRDDSADAGKIAIVRAALEAQGASVVTLRAGSGPDEEWHGARFAAVVVLGTEAKNLDPRLVQLTREFLASEKPVAALGGAAAAILQARGAAGRTLAIDGSLVAALESAGGKASDQPIHSDGSLVSAKAGADIDSFAARVVSEFTRSLEERDVDEMSEQSFPASDPPASTRSSMGHAPDDDAPARP